MQIKKRLLGLMLTFLVGGWYIFFPCLMVDAGVMFLENDSLLEQNFVTFRGNSKYNGATIGSHIAADDFAKLQISDDGGTHTDGNGNVVFSNYVIFKIDLLFDPQTKEIGDTGVKVVKDNCDWNDMDKANGYKYGDPETDTEQYIAYGAVSAVRINGNGSETKYAPIFSKGNTSVAEQIYNVDGDYTIYVFFQTKDGNDVQKHILSWSFKIRTKIYLLDESTGYSIKDSGISSKNVVVDYANRNETLSQVSQKVEVNCVLNGNQQLDIYDGYIMEAQKGTSAKYEFEVWANGFLAERFQFVIDTENLQESLLFGNLRKQTSDAYYEAEEYFYIVWEENLNNPIHVDIVYYDMNAPIVYDENGEQIISKQIIKDYQAGDKLDKIGPYFVQARSSTYTFDCWVEVVASDKPSYNYSTLSANRFNNFKTKWYQVYDRINDRYLCFDMSEYQRAYNAAMTIENSTVDRSSGRVYYNGRFYNDNIDATAAMNDYVFSQNLKTVYYDPMNFDDNDESIRTFSAAAFDGKIYLNDEFQFVKQHGAEVETVVATDKNGKEYPIKFFVPISEQGIPHGEYTIIETDKYGNETEYTVYRDTNAPEVALDLNGVLHKAADDEMYTVKGAFAVDSFYDDFDSFAVLRVILPSGEIRHFYQEEYQGISFVVDGLYEIAAYDRNGNIVEFSVTVE